MNAPHISVLLNEAVAALSVRVGGRYVDGTLGRAGHTAKILAAGGEVLGIDCDEQAIDYVQGLGLEHLTVAKGRHGELSSIAAAHGWRQVDGVLLDLGVSSPQLDEAERGFSFMKDGPLDMRMDQSCGKTAADLIESSDESSLSEVLYAFGEEKHARAIAKALAGRRFDTTLSLVAAVERVVMRRGAKHPATRVFQALRMAVNDEVGELNRALSAAAAILAPGGRLVVISFESITDRVVKRFIAAHVGRMISLQQGGERWEGELPQMMDLLKGGVEPTLEELKRNPRARSARLRAAVKC